MFIPGRSLCWPPRRPLPRTSPLFCASAILPARQRSAICSNRSLTCSVPTSTGRGSLTSWRPSCRSSSNRAFLILFSPTMSHCTLAPNIPFPAVVTNMHPIPHAHPRDHFEAVCTIDALSLVDLYLGGCAGSFFSIFSPICPTTSSSCASNTQGARGGTCWTACCSWARVHPPEPRPLPAFSPCLTRPAPLLHTLSLFSSPPPSALIHHAYLRLGCCSVHAILDRGSLPALLPPHVPMPSLPTRQPGWPHGPRASMEGPLTVAIAHLGPSSSPILCSPKPADPQAGGETVLGLRGIHHLGKQRRALRKLR